jgi:hypothetical protein
MSSPDMSQMRALGDFSPVYKWDVEFEAFPAALDYNIQNKDDLVLRCTSASIPIMESAPVEVSFKGNKMKQPGIYNYTHTIDLTFAETIDTALFSFIKEWRETCWETSNGYQELALDSKCEMHLYLNNRQDNHIWHYKLWGCFLEAYDPGGTPDSETSDIFRPVLTLSYDYFEDNRM